jgi:hypothetical protein
MSITFHSISGVEGSVELVGARAVVAMFSKYRLTRRRSEGQVLSWTLSADLSYVKENLLSHPRFPTKVKVKVPLSPGADTWYEVVPDEGVVAKLVDGRYVIEGAQICPLEVPAK